MKKAIVWVMLMAALLLSGCGQQDTPATSPEVAAMLPEGVAAAETFIDIDLTKMGGTTAYAYLINILTEPADYVGQRIRMRGTADESYLEETETTYHYVVLFDESSCCAQGVEYVLSDERAEYPALESAFEITGTLQPYEEDGLAYIHIVADEIKPV